MYKIYVFGVVLMTTIVHIVNVNMQSLTEEYSWRDYEGTIPFDALAGGLTRNGEPIYIGQALFGDNLIPGQIHKNDKNVYVELGFKEHIVNQNVKILCVQDPRKFEWIPTNSSELIKLSNRMLVKGGFEPKYFTYIGRALYDGQTNVAKIICNIEKCLGLLATDTNGKQIIHHIFEILTYNPNPSIGIRMS